MSVSCGDIAPERHLAAVGGEHQEDEGAGGGGEGLQEEPGYEVRTSELVGRRLVASRDTVAGAIVLRTLPLATGPLSSRGPGGSAQCLVCYKPLDEEDGVCECPECGWYMCSVQCSSHPRHLPECVATAATGVKISFEDPTRWDSLYDCIIILRCLSLRISSAASWNRLELMESHESIKRPANHRRRSQALAALFQARFGNAYGATISDVLRIIAILEINAMEVTSEGRSLQAIYPEACLAEHSCVPTAFRVFGSLDEGFPVVLRAAVDISSGSPVSLTYTDSLWGTPERRTHLYYSKLFLCNCKRCSDREEMGACLTALKCKKCSDCVLPDNPLSKGWLKGAKAEAAEKWSCRACKESFDGKSARRIVWQAMEAIKELESDEDAAVEQYEKVLETVLLKLHQRHSFVVDLKHSILHLLNPPESLKNKQLMTKEKFAREVLDVANILFPGISLLKGICLYELASCLIEKAIRKLDKTRSHLKETEKTLEECIYNLHYQSKCQPEYQLLTEAMKKLENITAMKNDLKK